MEKVTNRAARGEQMPRPEQDGRVLPAGAGSALTAVSPSPVPEIEAVDADLHSGAATKFTPAVSFTGYPDGETEHSYLADVEAEAPSNYVKHLKSKGLVADK